MAAAKSDISDLKDIQLLVDHFYQLVQHDELIGPIFSAAISDWGPHLQQMYRFWNAALFGAPGFTGNPFAKHARLPITPQHFKRWLELFSQTVLNLFEGEKATEAIHRANLMAEMFMRRLESLRNNNRTPIV